MSAKAHVLLVEDSETLAVTYSHYLKSEDLEIQRVGTGAEARKAIIARPPDIVLLDLVLPDEDGLEILRWIHAEGIPSGVIVMTAHSSVEIAVDAMRFGAADFLEKPFDGARLKTTVRNVLERTRLESFVAELKDTFERDSYQGFIGASLPMQTVYRIIDAAAPSKATVFITGESGTGKEVCAEAIHAKGPRAKKPFIAINCGAIPHDLMESEIFGHVKGAFTGAASDRAGAASRADGGTLFLDEIGEMSMDLQTKLLRFVQTGKFQKVGGTREDEVDVRFVCATNRDPLADVKEGRFREDLYYRLHVVPIQLSALRERGADVVSIARKFLIEFAQEENKRFATFTPEVEQVLTRYDWPGNVRQLQNVIRNITVLHDDTEVRVEHLPPPVDALVGNIEFTTTRLQQVDDTISTKIEAVEQGVKPLAQVERDAIEHAIAIAEGNIPKAAALLQVSPSTLYRKKQAWDADEAV